VGLETGERGVGGGFSHQGKSNFTPPPS